MNKKIDIEIEDKIAKEMMTSNCDPRVLGPTNQNHILINKRDFDAPNTYECSLMKPFERTKYKAFVPSVGDPMMGKDLTIVKEFYMRKLQEKFLSGANVVSSQFKNHLEKFEGYNNTIDINQQNLSQKYE